jgi:flavin reductase
MLDPQDFRAAMARVGAAVNIIVTDGVAGLHGMTASAVCSVSDTPPTLLICVNRSSRMHKALVENGRLSVNVLTGGQQDLSAAFSNKNIDIAARFAAAQWSDCGHGVPALVGALASFGCTITASMEVGTHSIFVCAVEHLCVGDDGAPGLVYFTRAYHQVAAKTQ